MNILVAETRALAQHAVKCLGLDESWRPVGYGEYLGAPRCERIVFLRPWDRLLGGNELAYIEHLQMRLPRDQKVAVV